MGSSIVEPTISKDILEMGRVDKSALLKSLFSLGASYSAQTDVADRSCCASDGGERSFCILLPRNAVGACERAVRMHMAKTDIGIGQKLANTDIGFRHNMVNTDIGFRQSTEAHPLVRREEARMYRSAMEELVAWKNSPRRKPLVVNGARQVGKTWLVLEFGRKQFESVAHVVFLDNEDMQRAFESTLDPDRLLMLIGAMTGTSPQDGKTLVFLDEIQECPRAITALKLFCEKRPDVPVIAAGSLLGVALSRKRKHASEDGESAESPASWPVGKVNYLDMHPMTFAEYVAAVGGSQLAGLLQSGDVGLIAPLADKFTDLMKTYLVVGGMPEVVQAYCDTGSFEQARSVQRELLRGYDHDFSKHVESALETERIRETWRSVPVQLARESDMRRFVYASIKKGARGRDYRDAVTWLVDGGLVMRVPRVSKPGIPLEAYRDESYFKLYFLDVGLLGAATNLDARAIVEGNRLLTEYKGVYAEQFVCQQLVAANREQPFYWSADGKQSKGEVDFVCECDGAVVPIEVKAEENVTGSSLAAFVKRYGIERAVRFSMRGWKDQGWLVNIPLYLAGVSVSYQRKVDELAE